MTVLVDTVRYARAGHLLWRDTGRHVLVLVPNAVGEVLSVGGGGAAVWRLLDHPRNLKELRDSFVGVSDTVPDVDSLADCLEQLAEHGVVQIAGER